jgi:DNA-binding LacI/PurR family transcriptional regulator
MQNLLQYQVDAIVLTSATISSAMTRICASRDTPVVSFNRYVPGLEIHAVSSDNIAGARQVADFPLQQGTNASPLSPDSATQRPIVIARQNLQPA